jgi:tetratricopeptide (TPR) repeat protein
MRDEAERLRDALDLYREGDLARAQMLLEMIEQDQLDPALHVEANYLWGLVLTKRGDAMEAASYFQRCVRLDRRFYPALDAWGNVLAGMGDIRGAIDKYRRALGVVDEKQAAHVLFNYGQVLQTHGYTLRALRKFRDSYKRKRSGDAAYMAGTCFLQLKRARGAMKWMQRALDAEPKSARNLVGLGNAFALSDRRDAAIVQYKAAIALDPGFADAHYNWALALAAQGEYAKAARQCKHGLRANPEGFELLAHQAYCLRQMGAYDAALQAGKRMRMLAQQARGNRRRPEFLDVMTANEAACLRALGRNQQARSRLLEQLRRARHASALSLAELRFLDRRRIRGAQRFELTVTVRVPASDNEEDEGALRHYQRTYWVIARDVKAARRIARELEPTEADLRFDARTVVSATMKEADQGVAERGPAVPVE